MRGPYLCVAVFDALRKVFTFSRAEIQAVRGFNYVPPGAPEFFLAYLTREHNTGLNVFVFTRADTAAEFLLPGPLLCPVLSYQEFNFTLLTDNFTDYASFAVRAHNCQRICFLTSLHTTNVANRSGVLVISGVVDLRRFELRFQLCKSYVLPLSLEAQY